MALKDALWSVMEYVPGPSQKEAHECGKSVIQIIGGVRAGKSMWTFAEIAKYCDIKDGLIWLVGPDYEQVRAEFRYLLTAFTRLEEKIGQDLIVRSSEPSRGSASFTTIWGLQVITKSTSKDFKQLASFAPDVFVMCEAAQQSLGVYEKSVERAVEKDALIILSGTLEGDVYPWYGEYFYRWQGPNEDDAASFSLPSWENAVIFPGGLDDPKIQKAKARLDEDVFLERFAAIPKRPSGLVFQKFSFKDHVFPTDEVPIDEHRDIELAIDPGYGGGYAVLFIQRIGLMVNVLDEVYCRRTLADDVIALVKERPLYPRVRFGVIDRAARQHHADRSQLEIWAKKCPHITLAWRDVSINDGIDCVNRHLKYFPEIERPALKFAPHLSADTEMEGRMSHSLGTFAEFNLYKWPEGVSANSDIKDRPIDRNNHALKALGYWLYFTYGAVADEARDVLQEYELSYWE